MYDFYDIGYFLFFIIIYKFLYYLNFKNSDIITIIINFVQIEIYIYICYKNKFLYIYFYTQWRLIHVFHFVFIYIYIKSLNIYI